MKWHSWIRARRWKLPWIAQTRSEAHGEKTMAAKRIHKPHRCAQQSKRVDRRADDRKQEELHLKVPHPKIRRDARLVKVLGSLIPIHVRTTRRSRLAVQFEAVQYIHQIAGTKRGAQDHPVFSSGERELMRFTLRCPRSCRSCVLRWR